MSDYNINDFFRNDDDFFRRFSFQLFYGSFVLQDRFLNQCYLQISRQRKLKPHLSVETHGVIYLIFSKILFIQFWKRRKFDGFAVSQNTPQLFANMRCVRGNDDCQWFQNLPFAAFQFL